MKKKAVVVLGLLLFVSIAAFFVFQHGQAARRRSADYVFLGICARKLPEIIPFQELSSLLDSKCMTNSTEIVSFILQQNDEFFDSSSEMPHTFISGMRDLSPTSVPLANSMWTILVQGYDRAPDNMVIAATKNIDLSKGTFSSFYGPTPHFYTEENECPSFLHDFGAVVLKDGTVRRFIRSYKNGMPKPDCSKPFIIPNNIVTNWMLCSDGFVYLSP